VFRATVLKGSVGSVFCCFFRSKTSIITTPTKKKNGICVKKVYGRPVRIGRVGLPETQDFFRPYPLLICHVKEVSQLNIMLLDSIESVSRVYPII